MHNKKIATLFGALSLALVSGSLAAQPPHLDNSGAAGSAGNAPIGTVGSAGSAPVANDPTG